MKKLIATIFLLTIIQTVSAGPSGIISSAVPTSGETVIKKLLEVRHESSLYSYAWIVRDGTGQTLLKLKHSNGTRGDQRIDFVVMCNSTGSTGKDHQYLGHSYYGSVERIQYFTMACPTNNIGLKFVTNEIWNSIDIAVKVVAAIFGTYTW